MSKLRTWLLAALALTLSAGAMAGETGTFLKNRHAKSVTTITPDGMWYWNFAKCKAYATANGVPLIAVWSNGDACSHCTKFENACNSTAFKNWMKQSGCIFYFTYPGDGGEGKMESSTFHWIRQQQTAFPFVRVYWYVNGKKKVDVSTVGDIVDGNERGEAGGKNAANYFKKLLKNYSPVLVDPELPYSIAFNANSADANGEMDPIDALYGTPQNLPANAFKRENWSFSGWAKSSTGSVAYKNGASVKGLTTKTNATVTLYARWTRMVYGTYYTGVKYTIKPSNYLGTLYKGYAPSKKIPGMTWNKTGGYWTGKPTTAGTYSIVFKKGSSSVTRTFVVVKDELLLPNADVNEFGELLTDTSTTIESAVESVSGGLSDVSVSGLPPGVSYMGGEIVGRPTQPGEYSVTVTGTSAKGQKLTKKIRFVVEEGDAILLNGLAHADELWALAGDDLEYQLGVKVKVDDGFKFQKLAAAEVSVCDEEGNAAQGVGFEDGKLVGGFAESGVYVVTVSAEVEGRPLATKFKIVVCEPDPGQGD